MGTRTGPRLECRSARTGRTALWICFVAAVLGGNAAAAQESVSIAGLKVAVWSKAVADGAPQPVLIFSHGFHGCATQSRFLMEAFASAGYLVFAPNHRDATCDGGGARWIEKAAVPFRDPDTWDDTTYRERADDIRHLIDALTADARFRTRADMTRLGLLGHSLGGYTALGLSGAWASWRVNGVKAVLALSPYSQPFVRHHTLGGVAAPVMYQSGTHDFGIAPSIRRPAGSYDQSPAPKYFVEFDQAGHGAWTDFSHTAHDAIIAYSLAFMNHYVKGDAADPLLTHGTPGVTLYRYVSDLGSSGATVGDESVPTPARPGVRERWRRWRHGDK